MPRQRRRGRRQKTSRVALPSSKEDSRDDGDDKPRWVQAFETIAEHVFHEDYITNLEEPNLIQRIDRLHKSNFNSFREKNPTTTRHSTTSDRPRERSKVFSSWSISRNSSYGTDVLSNQGAGESNEAVTPREVLDLTSTVPSNRGSILASEKKSSTRAKLSIIVDGKSVIRREGGRQISVLTPTSEMRSSLESKTSTLSTDSTVTMESIVTSEEVPRPTMTLRNPAFEPEVTASPVVNAVETVSTDGVPKTNEPKDVHKNLEKQQEDDLQEENNREDINEILSRFESPSCCSSMLARMGPTFHRLCCKYTPKIYFKEPTSWYSATAKLDAGSLLRENYLGITAGITVGYMSFFFFSTAFAHAPHIATLAACSVMLFAVFGIAFSEGVRCVLLITLPYFLSSRTRWLLLMVATGLVTTGPALNFMHNSGNFRNGIACVMGQVSSNVELIGKITKAPLGLIKNQLGPFLDDINNQLTQVRDAIKMIKDAILMVTKVLDTKSDWVRTMIESCGDEIAMKNQCLAFFNTLYFNCAASIKAMAFFCNTIRMFAEQACKSVSELNDICERESSRVISEVTNHAPVSEDQLKESEESLLRFMGHENITMEVGDSFVETDFGTNMSSQAEMTALIEEKMDIMMNGLNAFKRTIAWIVVIWTLATVLQLIAQSAWYKKKWVQNSFFDNSYITDKFVQQERRAFENNRPTTLPLSFGENMNYVTFSTWWWSRDERRGACGSLVFLLLGMSVLVMLVFADYAMYQVVLTSAPAFTSGFGKAKEGVMVGLDDSIPDFGLGTSEQTVPEIQGNSSMSEMGRSFIALANPLKDVAFTVDASICRPQAVKPNDTTTILVGIALAFTLISIVLQVYLLRLRHIILQWYYPEVANRRAAWLRAYIRNTRGLFYRLVHKFRNRKLKAPAEGSPPARLKFLDRFIFTNPRLAANLEIVGIKRVFCAQCSDAGNPNKKVDFAQRFDQCPRCGLYYCKTCQVDLKGICVDCDVPINVLSIDIDFERWSSDDEYDYFYTKYYTRRKLSLPKIPPTVDETLKEPDVKCETGDVEAQPPRLRLFLRSPGTPTPSALLRQLRPFMRKKQPINPAPMSRRRWRRDRATAFIPKTPLDAILMKKGLAKQRRSEIGNRTWLPSHDKKATSSNKKTQTPLVRLSALGGRTRWAWRTTLGGIGRFKLRKMSALANEEIGKPGSLKESISQLMDDEISEFDQSTKNLACRNAINLGHLTPIDSERFKRAYKCQPRQMSPLSNEAVGALNPDISGDFRISEIGKSLSVPCCISPPNIDIYNNDVSHHAISPLANCPGNEDPNLAKMEISSLHIGTLSGISPMKTMSLDLSGSRIYDQMEDELRLHNLTPGVSATENLGVMQISTQDSALPLDARSLLMTEKDKTLGSVGDISDEIVIKNENFSLISCGMQQTQCPKIDFPDSRANECKMHSPIPKLSPTNSISNLNEGEPKLLNELISATAGKNKSNLIIDASFNEVEFKTNVNKIPNLKCKPRCYKARHFDRLKWKIYSVQTKNPAIDEEQLYEAANKGIAGFKSSSFKAPNSICGWSPPSDDPSCQRIRRPGPMGSSNIQTTANIPQLIRIGSIQSLQGKKYSSFQGNITSPSTKDNYFGRTGNQSSAEYAASHIENDLTLSPNSDTLVMASFSSIKSPTVATCNLSVIKAACGARDTESCLKSIGLAETIGAPASADSIGSFDSQNCKTINHFSISPFTNEGESTNNQSPMSVTSAPNGTLSSKSEYAQINAIESFETPISSSSFPKRYELFNIFSMFGGSSAPPKSNSDFAKVDEVEPVRSNLRGIQGPTTPSVPSVTMTLMPDFEKADSVKLVEPLMGNVREPIGSMNSSISSIQGHISSKLPKKRNGLSYNFSKCCAPDEALVSKADFETMGSTKQMQLIAGDASSNVSLLSPLEHRKQTEFKSEPSGGATEKKTSLSDCLLWSPLNPVDSKRSSCGNHLTPLSSVETAMVTLGEINTPHEAWTEQAPIIDNKLISTQGYDKRKLHSPLTTAGQTNPRDDLSSANLLTISLGSLAEQSELSRVRKMAEVNRSMQYTQSSKYEAKRRNDDMPVQPNALFKNICVENKKRNPSLNISATASKSGSSKWSSKQTTTSPRSRGAENTAELPPKTNCVTIDQRFNDGLVDLRCGQMSAGHKTETYDSVLQSPISPITATDRGILEDWSLALGSGINRSGFKLALGTIPENSDFSETNCLKRIEKNKNNEDEGSTFASALLGGHLERDEENAEKREIYIPPIPVMATKIVTRTKQETSYKSETKISTVSHASVINEGLSVNPPNFNTDAFVETPRTPGSSLCTTAQTLSNQASSIDSLSTFSTRNSQTTVAKTTLRKLRGLQPRLRRLKREKNENSAKYNISPMSSPSALSCDTRLPNHDVDTNESSLTTLRGGLSPIQGTANDEVNSTWTSRRIDDASFNPDLSNLSNLSSLSESGLSGSIDGIRGTKTPKYATTSIASTTTACETSTLEDRRGIYPTDGRRQPTSSTASSSITRCSSFLNSETALFGSPTYTEPESSNEHFLVTDISSPGGRLSCTSEQTPPSTNALSSLQVPSDNIDFNYLTQVDFGAEKLSSRDSTTYSNSSSEDNS